MLTTSSAARVMGRDQWPWGEYGSRLNAGSGLNTGRLRYEGVLGHTRKMGVPV